MEGQSPSLQERIQLHEQFWQGTAPRPLLGFFYQHAGQKVPGAGYPAIDFDLSVEDVVAKYARVARAADARVGDRVPAVRVNYGTAVLPALAGAGYRHDGHTAWALPTGQNAAELRVPGFDPSAPLWQSYAAKLRALRDADFDRVVVTTQPINGPGEVLLGLLGAEQLFLDMYDRPDAVRHRLLELAQLCRQFFDAQWEIMDGPDGLVCFEVYVPGRSSLFTEDVLAMAGPEQFERFFREPLRQIAAGLETAFIHTHSAALACYPQLAEVREVDGVEISNDPNGPEFEALVEAGVRFQATGRAVMFSNWQRPLRREQVDYLLERCDPRRTLITLTVPDRAAALHHLDRVRVLFGSAV